MKKIFVSIFIIVCCVLLFSSCAAASNVDRKQLFNSKTEPAGNAKETVLPPSTNTVSVLVKNVSVEPKVSTTSKDDRKSDNRELFIEEAHSQGYVVYIFAEDRYKNDYRVYSTKQGKVSYLNKEVLDYEQYVGKLCYLKDPIEGEYGNEILPLVIETGETVFVSFFELEEEVYPYLGYGKIVRYEKAEETQELKELKYLLFEDYDVSVVDVEADYRDKKFVLSNGNYIYKSEYERLKQLVECIPFKTVEQRNMFLSVFLNSETNVSYDDFDEEFRLSVDVTDDISLSAYFTKNEGLTWAWFRMTYIGRDWKFIERVRMKSGSREYSFHEASYRSVFSSGDVYESVSCNLYPHAEKSFLDFLDAVFETGSLRIRMIGSDGNVDLSLDETQIQRVKSIVGLIKSL